RWTIFRVTSQCPSGRRQFDRQSYRYRSSYGLRNIRHTHLDALEGSAVADESYICTRGVARELVGRTTAGLATVLARGEPTVTNRLPGLVRLNPQLKLKIFRSSQFTL